MEGVWGGAAVSDDVLVRSIAELRKAFNDDSRSPAIFKTFPKQGYGLVAPLEVTFRRQAPALKERPLVPALDSKSSERKGALTLRRVVIGVAALAAVLAAGIWIRVARPLKPPYREAAWWKLDEAGGITVQDSSGFHNTGTIHGNPKWVSGKQGAAFWFGGVESFISGRSSSLPSGDAPRTTTAWFKAAVPMVDYASIFDRGSSFRGPTTARWTLGLWPDGRMAYGAPQAGEFISGSGRWNDGGWHFVAASYAGPATNRITILMDGQVDAVGKLNTAPATLRNSEWRIGMTLLNGAAFRGAIDDVREYPYALRKPWLIAMYRCTGGLHDLGSYYYLPVTDWDTIMESRRAGDISTPFRNGQKDLAGIQLARSDGNCPLTSLEGADVGQDLRIAVDLLVPVDAGHPTLAGPYFRSRRAAAGDGLIGGSSAGYWVQLFSSGMVMVRRLNPWAVVAFSQPNPAFDSTVFHHLEMEARGPNLTVWLDGQAVGFDQGGVTLERVSIPGTWDGPPRIGFNEGTAGVSFGAADFQDRGKAGGQRAKNLQLLPLLDP